MVMLAPAMASVWILLGSMLADVCDVDELHTGLRREGMYGAMYSWFVKAGVAAVLAISGFLLKISGVDSNLATQAPEAIINIRILFALVPAGFVLISLICTCFYPLSEKRMHEIRAQLNARKEKVSR
jgi:GPH family glycoside/pentoside/hexuronide:cation symporter